MGLEHVVAIANNGDLQQRVAGAAAVHGLTGDVVGWAIARKFVFAAQDGWAEAYATAAAQDEDHGLEGITDAMILTAVAAVIEADQEAADRAAADAQAAEGQRQSVAQVAVEQAMAAAMAAATSADAAEQSRVAAEQAAVAAAAPVEV